MIATPTGLADLNWPASAAAVEYRSAPLNALNPALFGSAVTALTAESAAKLGLNNTPDLAFSTPGLVMHRGTNTMQPSLRGITQTNAAAWQRTWTGVQGLSAPGPQTNHLYFALHGTTVICLQFTQLAGTSAVVSGPGRQPPASKNSVPLQAQRFMAIPACVYVSRGE